MVEPLGSVLDDAVAVPRIEVVDMTRTAEEDHPLFLLGLAVGAALYSVRCLWRAGKAALWRGRQDARPAMGPYRS